MDPVISPKKELREIAKNVLLDVLRVRREEAVTIETWTHTLPEANAFVLEARRIGAHPLLLYEDEPTFWASVKESPPEVLGRFSRNEAALLRETDAYVFLYGPASESRRRSLPPHRLNQIEAYNPHWYETARKSGVRFARLELGRVSEDRARYFGANAADWRRELLEASRVPPSRLNAISRPLERVFTRNGEVRITHRNGTDLRLRLKRRKPRADTGPAEGRKSSSVQVIPAGSLMISVDESFAEGEIVSNAPRHPSVGSPQGARWTFRGGRLTGYRYKSGQSEFRKNLERQGPEADRPGLLGFGLNPEIDSAPRCEYIRLGTVLVSVGGNSDYGGANRSPWMAYVLLRDPTVTVDGRPVMDRGRIIA
jgi:leucyl aminopeptidase (aminopeptidase T)